MYSMKLIGIKGVSSIKNKVIMSLYVLGIVLFFFIYFSLFFQKGIIFEGKFLKMDKSVSVLQYKGNVFGVPVKISTDRGSNSDFLYNNEPSNGNFNSHSEIDILYELSSIERIYKVEFHSKEDVKVYQRENLIFDGKYIPSPYNSIELFDKDGKPYLRGMVTVVVNNNRNIFNDSYQVGALHIIKTAMGRNIVNRGNPSALFVAILLLIILLVDIKFPKFFFYTKHFLSVEDPEPSELYLVIQKGMWYITPVIILIILIVSLN